MKMKRMMKEWAFWLNTRGATRIIWSCNGYSYEYFSSQWQEVFVNQELHPGSRVEITW